MILLQSGRRKNGQGTKKVNQNFNEAVLSLFQTHFNTIQLDEPSLFLNSRVDLDIVDEELSTGN
jgi:hypothetical protein